ncbi:MAG: RNA polymerase factor sigma-54 [Planctomycetota bacterium]
MRLDTGQNLRIDQRMKLAPRMIQSMEVLQMPQAALEERIEQELGSNPTLELAEVGPDEAALSAEKAQSERDAAEPERELTGEVGADDFERLGNLSEQYAEDWSGNLTESGDPAGGEFARRRAKQIAGDRDGKLDALANTASRTASLGEQLLDQWRLTDVDPELRALGAWLIGWIDADGYLRADEAELLERAAQELKQDDGENLEDNKLSASMLRIAVASLQDALEPPGLAARDLRECLLLQIDALRREDPVAHQDPVLTLARRVVDRSLKDVEANRLPKIARDLGVDLERVKAALGSLRRFDPHPGRQLADAEERVIRPDLVVEFDEEQRVYTAELVQGRLPALTISEEYAKIASDRDADTKTREFVRGQLRSAQWLLEAIDQRQATLLRVAGVVVAAQHGFFESGPEALRPLPMTQVADQLGVHVATVSRAVSEKYMQTPRGVYPLRMFFSGGTETDAGQAVSWAAVQAKLKQVIDAEDKSAPLSDDQLVEAMGKQGIELARRTVAKYRKQLGVATARQRREY